ncbi:phosphopantetheine-binding protein [Paenibacillus sp. FSL H7-0737]|uniref:phosphopantetheine-binding protein n=1 Tax=Paenibacillus TaxID=44249 RepID=UPI0004F7E391|nr:phosphopantetheine-binding protein [Paenibacillus sp. FSL H7-0737]AIQ22952.1 hypothetical protein H70737_08850 [Paenibacillus sp. FSL H7-0737]
MANIREKIICCLSNIGCIINEDEENFTIEIEDSIMLISFIVELEVNFDIEIPDELLTSGRFEKCNDVIEMLSQLIERVDSNY